MGHALSEDNARETRKMKKSSSSSSSSFPINNVLNFFLFSSPYRRFGDRSRGADHCSLSMLVFLSSKLVPWMSDLNEERCKTLEMNRSDGSGRRDRAAARKWMCAILFSSSDLVVDKRVFETSTDRKTRCFDSWEMFSSWFETLWTTIEVFNCSEWNRMASWERKNTAHKSHFLSFSRLSLSRSTLLH